MRILLSLATALALFAGSAGAQTGDANVELTPFGGYRFGGTLDVADSAGSYELEDASSFGLIVNFPHRTNTKWEILYSRQSTKAEFSGVTINDPLIDIELQILQLGGIYLFEGHEGKKILPYLAATIGATHARASSIRSENDTYWSGSFGLGWLFSPSSRVGLRLEARAYGTFTDSSTDLLCRTGPNTNVCAVRIEGDLLTQIETFAGVVIRF